MFNPSKNNTASNTKSMDKNKYLKRRYRAFLFLEQEGLSIPAFIVRFPEGENEEVVLRLEDERTPDHILEKLTENRKVFLRVDVGGGGMDVYSGILAYCLNISVHLSKVCLLEKLQRREEVKAPFPRQGQIFCQMPGREEVCLTVLFRDISAGGVGFLLSEVSDDIQMGDVFQMTFQDEKQPFSLDFEVRRILQLPDGTVNCGGKFLKLHRGADSALRKYVFELERQEIIRQKQVQALLEELEALEQAQQTLLAEREAQENEEKERKENEKKARKKGVMGKKL